MRLIEARGLPENPTDASSVFYQAAVPEIRAAIGAGDLPVCLVFDPADRTHTAWRKAAVQALAREAAPGRINAIAGGGEAALAAGIAYLARAPGVTGQYLPLDGQGVGNPAH
jgi:hypothetical protein